MILQGVFIRGKVGKVEDLLLPWLNRSISIFLALLYLTLTPPTDPPSLTSEQWAPILLYKPLPELELELELKVKLELEVQLQVQLQLKTKSSPLDKWTSYNAPCAHSFVHELCLVLANIDRNGWFTRDVGEISHKVQDKLESTNNDISNHFSKCLTKYKIESGSKKHPEYRNAYHCKIMQELDYAKHSV